MEVRLQEDQPLVWRAVLQRRGFGPLSSLLTVRALSPQVRLSGSVYQPCLAAPDLLPGLWAAPR